MPRGGNTPRKVVNEVRKLSPHDEIVVGKAAALMRPCVAAFAEQMEQKLRINDHKGGWTSESNFDKLGNIKYLLRRIKQEVDELERAIENALTFTNDDQWRDKITKEAADVGNFSMMIADAVGGLREDGKSYGK